MTENRVNKTLVKICGLRRPEDARAANAAGPDFAGFILSPGFRRSIRLDQAQEMRAILSPAIRTVGVFVDAAPEEILRAAQSGCIDLIQLHGNEGDDEIRAVRDRTGLPVIRAYRISGREDLEAAAASPAQWILLDSGTGTGRTFDWELLEDFLRENRSRGTGTAGEEGILFPGGHPWLLAGGLSAENVAEAVRRFRPTAVDVSSNVETDGWKDPARMLAFTQAVR